MAEVLPCHWCDCRDEQEPPGWNSRGRCISSSTHTDGLSWTLQPPACVYRLVHIWSSWQNLLSSDSVGWQWNLFFCKLTRLLTFGKNHDSLCCLFWSGTASFYIQFPGTGTQWIQSASLSAFPSLFTASRHWILD